MTAIRSVENPDGSGNGVDSFRYAAYPFLSKELTA